MIDCTFENGGKTSLRHVTVGAVVFNGKNQVLLIKRSEKFSRPGTYSVPGGFLDRDEDSINAVLRELREEAGFEGEIVSLFHLNDNPQRPKEDRQNVDFIYLVNPTGGEFKKNEEVTSATWFDEDSLPDEEEFAFDHRTTILRAFEYKRKPFALPLLGKL